MNRGEETRVHINKDPVFQLIYDMETGVHLNSDAGFHLICLPQGPAFCNGSPMGHGDEDGCLLCPKCTYWMFNWGVLCRTAMFSSPSRR